MLMLGQRWRLRNKCVLRRDVYAATEWFRKAAEQGYDEAQAQLGILYALGEGVHQDLHEAAKWLRMANDQGNKRAQDILPIILKKLRR